MTRACPPCMNPAPMLSPFDTVDTVLFDFDGTLMDASDAICGAFRYALGGDGAGVTDARVGTMIGRPLRDMFLDARPEATEQDVDGLVARYREAFFPLAETKTHPLPGAQTLVRERTGIKRLSIVTTSPPDPGYAERRQSASSCRVLRGRRL